MNINTIEIYSKMPQVDQTRTQWFDFISSRRAGIMETSSCLTTLPSRHSLLRNVESPSNDGSFDKMLDSTATWNEFGSHSIFLITSPLITFPSESTKQCPGSFLQYGEERSIKSIRKLSRACCT